MADHWPTEAQKQSWQEFGDAQQDALEECEAETGMAKQTCRARILKELLGGEE